MKKLIIIIAAVVCTLGTAAGAAVGVSYYVYNKNVTQAEALNQAGKYEEAIAYYQKSMKFTLNKEKISEKIDKAEADLKVKKWKEAYINILENSKIEKFNDGTYDYNVKFENAFLYDLERDGVPELIVTGLEPFYGIGGNALFHTIIYKMGDDGAYVYKVTRETYGIADDRYYTVASVGSFADGTFDFYDCKTMELVKSYEILVKRNGVIRKENDEIVSICGWDEFISDITAGEFGSRDKGVEIKFSDYDDSSATEKDIDNINKSIHVVNKSEIEDYINNYQEPEYVETNFYEEDTLSDRQKVFIAMYNKMKEKKDYYILDLNGDGTPELLYRDINAAHLLYYSNGEVKDFNLGGDELTDYYEGTGIVHTMDIGYNVKTDDIYYQFDGDSVREIFKYQYALGDYDTKKNISTKGYVKYTRNGTMIFNKTDLVSDGTKDCTFYITKTESDKLVNEDIKEYNIPEKGKDLFSGKVKVTKGKDFYQDYILGGKNWKN